MLAIIYWVLLVIYLVYGGWLGFQPENRIYAGGNFLLFILFVLIGLKVFPVPL